MKGLENLVPVLSLGFALVAVNAYAELPSSVSAEALEPSAIVSQPDIPSVPTGDASLSGADRPIDDALQFINFDGGDWVDRNALLKGLPDDKRLKNFSPGTQDADDVKKVLLQIIQPYDPKALKSTDSFGVLYSTKTNNAWWNVEDGCYDKQSFLFTFYPKKNPTTAIILYPLAPKIVTANIEGAKILLGRYTGADKEFSGAAIILINQNKNNPNASGRDVVLGQELLINTTLGGSQISKTDNFATASAKDVLITSFADEKNVTIEIGKATAASVKVLLPYFAPGN